MEDFNENEIPNELEFEGENENTENYEVQEGDDIQNENIPEEEPMPQVEFSEEDLARKQAKRDKLISERRKKEEEKIKKQKSIRTTLIIFGIIIFVVWMIYFSLTSMMPNHLIRQGQKYMELQNYPKAYRMFKMASNAKPYDEEPVYLQAVALSKMPFNYETQQALYEISQLEDFDKASEYADSVLENLKKQIERQLGSSYIDNVLFEGILFRWNISEPITFSIFNNNNSPVSYPDAVRRAFANWSAISNGMISFREINSNNANIVVTLSGGVPSVNNIYDPDRSGAASPIIENNVLKKVDILLRTNQDDQTPYDIEGFKEVALHEIGHALGIWGHSSNPDDIMYYSGDYFEGTVRNKSLSKRDANTLTLLYKMVPDVINNPIDPSEYNDLFYHYVITTVPGDDFEREIQRLLAELSYNDKDIVNWVNLAINYAIKKQYKKSNTILQKILPLAKNDTHNQFVILYNIAANYYRLKEYKESQEQLKLATFIHNDIDTEILDAFNDLKLGKKEQAKNKLVLLSDKYPDNVEIALKLAYIYSSNKDRKHSKEVIDKVIKANPGAGRDRRVLKYKIYNAKNN